MHFRIKKTYLSGFIIFLLLMLWSGSPYQTMSSNIANMQIAVAVGMGFIGLYKFKKQYKVNLYYMSFFFLITMILLTWISHLSDMPLLYIKQIAFVLISFYITMIVGFNAVVHVYLKTMTFISVISLVGYFLLNNTDLLNGLPRLTNVNDVSYGIGIIFNYIVHEPKRNCAIFWEPGIFASYLTFGVIFELYFKEGKKSWLRLLVFISSMITANSAAGFILICFCIALFITPKIKNKKNVIGNVISYGVFIILLLVALNIESIIYNSPLLRDNLYVHKLLPERINDSERVLGILHNIEFFLSEPIFGAGLATVSKNMSHIADISTSVYLMSIYGILGVSYTIFWAIGIFRQTKLNLHTRILLFVMIIFIVNKETHSIIMFPWCILFYMLKNDGRSCEKKMETV